MPYPSPTTADTTALTGIFLYLNTVTRGWFSNMILISLYTISLYAYYKATDRFAEGMAVVGFFVFVVSLLFFMGGILSVWVFIIVIAIAIMGVIALLIN